MAASAGTAAQNFLVPLDLQPAYFLEASPGLGSLLPGIVVAAGVIGLGVAAVRTGHRDLAFATAWLLIAWAPYSQLFFIPRSAADTYLYLPGLAALVAIVFGARALAQRFESGERLARLSIAFAVIVAAVFAVVSRTQVARWRDGATLWEPLIERYPTAARPYRHVAFHYWSTGDVARAAALIEQGYPAFRLQKNIPFWAPLVLEQAGRAGAAASMAADALQLVPQPEPTHYKTFLEVVARNDIAIPPDPAQRALLEDAVAEYVRHDDWMTIRNADLGIAAYLVTRKMPRLAVPLLQHALGRAAIACDAWEVARAANRQLAPGSRLQPPSAECSVD
jgi:hypothetical protein